MRETKRHNIGPFCGDWEGLIGAVCWAEMLVPFRLLARLWLPFAKLVRTSAIAASGQSYVLLPDAGRFLQEEVCSEFVKPI
ncbi:hypothetical protein [Ruegeria lacuscaerulensis]|uniref:hypothetical protein n=1 Tax=Ruegeria lacuscaerulensis TaxID=55218 RepID=UPI00147A2ED3|nr:hypothetical protein [Ruegeria lacuscaerulensis]